MANFFRELGIAVYDSDAEAKLLMVESKQIRNALIDLFGTTAYVDKKLNKTLISEMVFNDKEKLGQLNQIVHPAVKEHFIQWSREQNSPYVIQETALIFENSAQANYDAIILVTAPEHIRIQRVMDRDGVLETQVKARIKNQLPDSEKEALADYVIENLELEGTRRSVDQIHKKLLAKTLL